MWKRALSDCRGLGEFWDDWIQVSPKFWRNARSLTQICSNIKLKEGFSSNTVCNMKWRLRNGKLTAITRRG